MSKKKLCVPSEANLRKYYKAAKQRSVKLSKKQKSIRKVYTLNCQEIINYIYSEKSINHEYLFMKVLCLLLIKEMINQHEEIFKFLKEESNDSCEAYLIDQTKLCTAYEIIKNIIMGEKDWYED